MKPESALFLAPAGVLRTLLERTAGVVGQDFFRHLVRTLAVTLDTEYAFVTTRKPQDANRLTLVAGWHVNRAAAGDSEFLTEGTPAARVLLEGQLWHEDGVASDYPKDRWLRKHGVRAYCAVAIPGFDSHAIGHLGVMSRQPFQASDELFAALRTLAVRSAAELRRRRLDEMQRLAAMKFAAAFRTTHDIIGVYELASARFSDINPAVETVLGYSPAEIIGRSADELGIWEFPQEYADLMTELKLAGHVVHSDVHLLTRSGERRHAVFHAEVMEMDQRAYALMHIFDQTEYQAAINKLTERDGVFHALLNSGTEMVLFYRIGAEGRATGYFTDVNEMACQLLGYVHGELQGMAPSALSENKNWKDIGYKLLTENVATLEATLHCKNGRLLPVEVHARLLMLNGQRTVMLVAHDLSQRQLQADALQDAERQYRSIFENAIEGIYQSMPDGRIISANPALARILGYSSPQEIVINGLNIASRIYVDSGKRAQLLRHIEENGQYTDQEFQIFRSDGSSIWVCDNARVVRDGAGKVLYYEGIIQDITPRKQAEEALIKSEEKYRTLVDTSQDGVFLSQAGKFVYVNRAFARMLGYASAAMIGMPAESIVAVENSRLIQEIGTDRTPEDSVEPQEAQLLCQDGTTRITTAVTMGGISWRGRPAITGTVRDITEHKKVEQELMRSAHHDPLTELPNRSFFMERLRQALTQNGKRGTDNFAILFLDLDRFKLINDSLGHSFGDRLLVAISKRLRTCIRPMDFIARHGGDEFTILLENISGLDDATALADRVHEGLARAFNIDGHDVFSTASIGIVISAPHYRQPDELLRDADTAMYRAKAAGKSGYVVFDEAMHARVRENLQLETELRHALQRNEFRVFYQPIMNLSSGRLTGFEALVRWVHPTRGLVGPEQFLSVAEETGLIVPLGWWVMEIACTQLAQWKKRYRHLAENITISVNIANRQFAHWVLPQRVARILDITGIAARDLCLEITETVFMDNPELAAETIKRLDDIGVNLQMDDFGTGYSSLSALRNFKLHSLKIDRSFIAGIERHRSDRAIVRTITVLAADLGMDVVAEGIENSRQLELLRALGCRKGQGYYFSKPLSNSQIERYLTALAPPKA